MIVYGVVSQDGRLLAWTLRPSATEARRHAAAGLMGASEYDRLGNDPDRWKKVFKEGYRVRKVRVELEP
jgi:hypothetical protein